MILYLMSINIMIMGYSWWYSPWNLVNLRAMPLFTDGMDGCELLPSNYGHSYWKWSSRNVVDLPSYIAWWWFSSLLCNKLPEGKLIHMKNMLNMTWYWHWLGWLGCVFYDRFWMLLWVSSVAIPTTKRSIKRNGHPTMGTASGVHWYPLVMSNIAIENGHL